MKTKIYRLFVVLSLVVIAATACTDGQSIMSNNSNAKQAYNYALCLQNAGNDFAKAAQCVK